MSARILTTLLLVFGAAALSAAEEIRISASDLLADYIRAPLEAYGEENEIDFDIDSIGTLPSLDRLQADETDLAIIAVPEGREVPREEFFVYPFAYDVAIVVVNQSNPIDEVSMSRLGGIFGVNEEFNLNTWGDLGLSGWGNRSIKPLVGQKPGSISFELFKNSVLKRGGVKPSVSVVKDDEVEQLVAADSVSIAVMPALPDNEKLKTLMISTDEDSPAFPPSEENVHYDDYPIRLSFFIAFEPRDEARLKPAVRALLGDAVAKSLRENGFFALPDTVRRKLLIDLEIER